MLAKGSEDLCSHLQKSREEDGYKLYPSSRGQLEPENDRQRQYEDVYVEQHACRPLGYSPEDREFQGVHLNRSYKVVPSTTDTRRCAVHKDSDARCISDDVGSMADSNRPAHSSRDDGKELVE